MTHSLTVEGMSCDGCESTVTDALESVDGVTDVEVDHEADSATVEGTAETEELVTAVEDAGYDATAENV